MAEAKTECDGLKMVNLAKSRYNLRNSPPAVPDTAQVQQSREEEQ